MGGCRLLGQEAAAEGGGDDNAKESVLPHPASLSHGIPGGLQVGLGNAGARRLSIRLAEPSPGKGGRPWTL